MVAVLECHHYPSFFGLGEIPDEFKHEISAVTIADLLVNLYMGTGNTLSEPHPKFFENLGVESSLENLLTDERRAMLDKIAIEGNS